jgi:hypothetical protein
MPADSGGGQQDLHVLRRNRCADPHQGSRNDRGIEALRADRSFQHASGVAERRARHDGEGHGPDCATGPGMHAGARWNNIEDGKPAEEIADWYKRIGKMKDEHETIRDGAIAGPAGEANDVKAIIVRESKRSKGAGRGPGRCRASQLRVKLGTMRPPIKPTRAITSATAKRVEYSANPLICASIWNAMLPAPNSETIATTGALPHFRPAMISRAAAAASSTRKAASMVQATSHPIHADMHTAMRPASQLKTSTASGVPCNGRRPVQFGTAVSRKPPMMAAT